MQGEILVSYQSTLFFETPEEIYRRVARELKPRTPLPEIRVEFRRYTNANSRARLEDGRLLIRLADIFEDAPAPVLEALAFILLGKLYRKPVPPHYQQRYRLFLERGEVRSQLHHLRRVRGRKYVSGPQGRRYDLAALFDALNLRYFDGQLPRPLLGWSRRPSRTLLGHFDPSHHAIILSSLLDQEAVPAFAVESVLYHEMLHIRYPIEHRHGRRCIHTPEFRAAERRFESWRQAREFLRRLAHESR